jgi:hypothetical protein
MPFTVDAVNKKITFEFIAGDPKGNSLANAVTVDDYQAAMVAAGQGASWTKQGNQHLITGYSIIVTGAATYVHFYNACIEWTGVVTQSYLLLTGTTSHFQVGTDVANDETNGCLFLCNQTVLKLFLFNGYTKVYDSTFISAIDDRYSIDFNSISEDNPIYFCRNRIYNAFYCKGTQVGYNAYYVVFDDNFLWQTLMRILTSWNWLSENNLNAVGSMFDWFGDTGTKIIRNWNAPRGTGIVRAYNAYNPILRKVDCLTGAITLRADYALSTAGAKAQEDSISTFSIYIENGENAAIVIKDVDGNTILTDVLDVSGELETELMFKRRYHLKLTDIPATYETYNKTFTPFSIQISKVGWKTLTIGSIEIEEGYPTIIRATLEYPELYISAVDITDCTEIGADDGQLVITAQGGDGTYEYSLDGVIYQASDTFTDLAPDDYTVYVRDGEGTVATFDVTISEPIPEAYAETVLRCDLTEEVLTCDLTEEVLICELTE